MAFYPVNLNIEKRVCIIVGGGSVAHRKAVGLLEAGASIRVISPQLVEGLQQLVEEQRLEWFPRNFAEGDLQNGFMVFGATDNRAVQLLVAEEAEKYGVLLNSADDPVGSDFHVPAHFRRGDILIAVGTGGGSPALAKALRKKLEDAIGPEYEAVVELLAAIREQVVGLGSDSEEHGAILRNLLQQGIVDIVLERSWFDLQMLMLEELPEEVDGVELLKKFLEKYDQG